MFLKAKPVHERLARFRGGGCRCVAVFLNDRVEDSQLFLAHPATKPACHAGVYLRPVDEHCSDDFTVKMDRVNFPILGRLDKFSERASPAAMQ